MATETRSGAVRADSPAPSDKSDNEDDVREAVEAIRRGEYRHALHLLGPACEGNAATAVEALRWTAQAHSNLGAHERAEQALRKAQAKLPELDPERRASASASVHLRLAACAQRRGDDEAAAAMQELAVSALDPGNRSHMPTLAAAWNNLGITRLRVRGADAARPAFERAVELRRTLGDPEGYCLAAANLASLSEDPAEVAAGMREHLGAARALGASKSLLRTLEVNLANALEEMQEWRGAAKARRGLFELAVPDEELRSTARCARGACGASKPPLRCGRCKVAFFCNAACQQAAWPAHRHECRARDEAGERAKGCRSCPICLEEMDLASPTKSAPVRILACLHVLHAVCWNSFTEARDSEASCPVCRDSLPTQR
eukprot:TRINITY_DN14202_c0_g7_i1.p1 TRINITY_DN14202_c0_g7~~TRINITY_DN14202_c0_g7_i1.p1  ORF type:complete len:375 (-),score=78.07 TRINITY_DN14202_c0_g7_i1:41-1165(-)